MWKCILVSTCHLPWSYYKTINKQKEVATGGVLQKKMLSKTWLTSQENTSVGVSFWESLRPSGLQLD